MAIPRLVSLVLLFTCSLANVLSAQCPLTWSPLGGGLATAGESLLAILPLQNGQILAARNGLSTPKMSLWNGVAWTPFADGTNANVNAMLQLANGDVVVGGSFTTIGNSGFSINANRIARWNGTSWSGVGGGIDLSIVSRINAMVVLPNGHLVIGGWFSTAGGVPCERIARWNGSTWSPLGAGVDSNVYALAALPNGDVVAGGNFSNAGGSPAANIARWNGSAWAPLGVGTDGVVAALAVLPDGRLVAGGSFFNAGGVAANRIAVWNGSVWSAIGAGVQGGGVNALLVRPNGDLLAGGNFTSAGGQAALRVARWNGSSWSQVAAGFGTTQLFDFSSVAALARTPNGELLAGGSFSSSGGTAVGNIARTTTSCPAAVGVFGSSCAGAAQPLIQTSSDLPVLGTTFTSNTTGFVVGGVAIECLGTASLSVPLAQLSADGVIGCQLLSSLDLRFVLAQPVAGTLTTNAAVPNDVGLAGLTVYGQTLQLSLDAQSALRIESSNGLTMTLGTF